MNHIIRKIALVSMMALVAGNFSFAQTKGEIKVDQKQETYTPSFKIDGKHRKVKNVILMIGDGMGLAHAASAMYANGGSLTMTNLHSFGFARTQSASDFTTDSAASGTAYSTGHKTHNGAIGVDVNDQPLETLVENLSAQGYATGIISTDSMDGATPSAFFAHQKNRNMSREIWADLPSSPVNFAAAGNQEVFEKQPESTQTALKENFEVVYTLPQISDSRKIVYLPTKGESDSVNNPERKDFLPATTAWAIKHLQKLSKKGFFIMVEGARIDKSSHNNDYPAMVKEVLDFDLAIKEAIKFAEADGHTLVIISADHETGALSLRDGNMKEGYMEGMFSSGSHTSIMVPVYAYGPWSDAFRCVQENSDISNKIKAILSK